VTEDPLRYFRIEARELVDQLSQGVLDLERTPADPEPVRAMLRAAHTFKGAARVVRQTALADQAHAVEELLVPYRQGDEPVPPQTVSGVMALVDRMAGAVDELSPATPPGTAEPSTAQSAGAPGRAPAATLPTVRADVRDVDELLDVVGEAHAQLAPLRRQVNAVERTRRSAELLADRLRARAAHGSGELDRTPEPSYAMADRLAGELGALARYLGDSVTYVQRELDEVRRHSERLRLAPASSIFGPLRRAVRDVADAEAKQVTFATDGGDLRLDPQVLTLVGNGLLHVVRNAVAHGIEPPAARLAAGKPAEGQVRLEVQRRGRHASFRCHDDGRGLDLAALRRAAEATGWQGTGVDEQDLPALVGLLLHGGISTAANVTVAAGRGIGLDVLRDISEQLGGEITVDTAPGLGTTVEVVVPLMVVSMQGLSVRVGSTSATIPLDAVRGCVRLDGAQTARAVTAGALTYDGHLVPYLPLADLLARSGPAGGVSHTVAVLVADGELTVAIGAEELLGMSTLVARPLPDLAPAAPIVDSVTLDIEGVPRIVLDPQALVAAAASRTPHADRSDRADADATRSILVVDDSLTTRMLERSILESAGYRVDVAASGEQGLSMAHGGYALFLVDIDMPGIDGFTFVERVRADPDLAETPVVLVSSRNSPEDRRRGAQAGADGYMAKGEFDQGELLDRISRLVAR